MAKRKLSLLQKAYREFFLALLGEYEVDSPAKLTYTKKKEFFTVIKQGWKEKKAELTKPKERKTPLSRKSQYAKVRGTKPSIALEPKVLYPKTLTDVSENDTQKILSEENPNQKDDLKIGYHPHSFFDQEETLYSYPVVKMPREGSYLKLPRKGRAQNKGYKEQDFHKAILAHIPEVEVDVNLHLTIPYYNKPYEPDIVLIDRDLNLYIDIEIDEPYDGYYRYPTHEAEKDDTRDLFFTESGWIVIRFSEKQVHLQEKECIAYIKDVLNSIYTYRFEELSNCSSEPQWEYQQAVRWEKLHYREKYLGIEKFGKQKTTTEIIVNANKFESIEYNISRTEKFKTTTNQDNIAFEDETHKYHHPKDSTGNAEYISVTTLIDRFFPFDLERFIEVKAKKEDRSKEDVLDEFIKNRDEAAEKGTYLHEQIENFFLGKEYDPQTKEFDLFLKFYEKVIVAKGFQFVEAEKKILLDEYNVAGTIDALFKKPEKDEYIMIDWKRSKNLLVDGYPKKYGFGYALSELNHLDNSSYYKYALQQSFYKYILQKKCGIMVSSMNLIVLYEKFDKYHRVDLNDYKKEIAIILESINHKL